MISRFDHKIDGVTIFHVVIFHEFPVGESLSFQEETLGICRRSSRLGGELHFNE